MTVRLERPNKERPILRPLLRPLVILLVLILLNFAVFNFGNSLITNQKVQLQDLRKIFDTLTNKVNVLSQLDATISSDYKSLLAALPERNPALFMLSQVGKVSNQFGLTLGDSKVGIQSKFVDDINRTLISTTVESENATDSINYALDLTNYLPYNTPATVKIKRIQDIYSAEVDSFIYWSISPTTIVGLTEPIQDLSSSEVDIVNEIKALKKPEFALIEPKNEIPRTNPFN